MDEKKQPHSTDINTMNNLAKSQWRNLKPSRSISQRLTLFRTYKTHTIDWDPIKSSKQKPEETTSSDRLGKRIFLGLMFLMPVATFGLGTWQFSRLKWKTDLISSCEDRLVLPPLPLPAKVDPNIISQFEYRRVLITGHYDYSQEMFVGPRVLNGVVGYNLVCPFIRSNGGDPILVERGWISKDKVDPESRSLKHLSVPQGEITIECLLRTVPDGGVFNYSHELGTRLFHWVDLDVMCKQTRSLRIYAQVVYDMRDHPEYANTSGGPANDASTESAWKFWKSSSKSSSKETNEPEDPNLILEKYIQSKTNHDPSAEFAPFQFIKAGVPLGKVPKVDFKNNHLQYLVTWYGLSIASTFLLYVALTKKGSGGSAATAEKLKHAKQWM